VAFITNIAESDFRYAQKIGPSRLPGDEGFTASTAPCHRAPSAPLQARREVRRFADDAVLRGDWREDTKRKVASANGRWVTLSSARRSPRLERPSQRPNEFVVEHHELLPGCCGKLILIHSELFSNRPQYLPSVVYCQQVDDAWEHI
jgi:hypothetical protein